jgi:hypothetical protein
VPPPAPRCQRPRRPLLPRPRPLPGTPQTYHWNEKRRIAEFYSGLAKKEAEDEAAYTAELRGKLKTLEDELLA